MKQNPEKKSNRGGKRAGSGRKKLIETAPLTVRVSKTHKKRFTDTIPPEQRRPWMETLIDLL